jgi:hypothetical protein
MQKDWIKRMRYTYIVDRRERIGREEGDNLIISFSKRFLIYSVLKNIQNRRFR